jgi:hypothetical protein
MHAIIRRYVSSPEVLAEARPKLAHLEQTMRGIPGFVAYYFLSTDDGIATITITEDETGTSESMERAARWVQENLQTRAGLGAPEVTTGQALLSAIRAEAPRQDATEEGQRLATRGANRTPNVVRGDGTKECPAGYPVKGNGDSGLYHEPGSSSYAQTIPEFCFTSVSAAEAAGFHAPGQ